MKEKINKIIIELIESSDDLNETPELTPDTKLREDLGLDSFNLAELTVHIEDEFDIDIFEDGLVNTLGEIYEIIESNQ